MRRWQQVVMMALVIAQSACVKWVGVAVPVPPAPPNIISNPSRVHVSSGQSVEFLTLVVATDSLFGVRNNDARTRLTVSLDQVRRIEVRQKDALRTLGLLAVIGGALYWTGALGVGPNR
jgi:hypothetical protein